MGSSLNYRARASSLPGLARLPHPPLALWGTAMAEGLTGPVTGEGSPPLWTGSLGVPKKG